MTDGPLAATLAHCKLEREWERTWGPPPFLGLVVPRAAACAACRAEETATWGPGWATVEEGDRAGGPGSHTGLGLSHFPSLGLNL